MYRVVIADDEPWALYRIQSLVEQNQLGFEISGTAGDGLTALELVRKEQPVLLLSDIRMPELDGLQLVKEVKRVSPQTLVVLITGFSDFTYAVEALRHGVLDYLVKPIKKEQISNMLERVLQRLQEQEASDAYNAYFTLFSGDKTISLRKAFELAGIANPLPHAMLVTITLNKPIKAPLIRLMEGGAVCLRTGQSKMTLLIQTETSEKFCILPSLLPDGALFTGYSSVAPLDESFQTVLRQSEIAMLTALTRGSNAPYVYSFVPSPVATALQERFQMALNQQNQVAMLTVIQQLRSAVEALQFDELLKLSNNITTRLREHRFGEYEALELQSLRQIDSESPIDALLIPIEYAIQQHKNHAPVTPSQIQCILQAIDDSYTQGIKLADISKRFFLSANYMSILIKKETGMTFSEIIIHKRISMAKKLLTETDAAIQDVMEQVGYQDYSSFIKLFQKHVGCTPYAYRKEMQKQAEEMIIDTSRLQRH